MPFIRKSINGLGPAAAESTVSRLNALRRRSATLQEGAAGSPLHFAAVSAFSFVRRLTPCAAADCFATGEVNLVGQASGCLLACRRFLVRWDLRPFRIASILKGTTMEIVTVESISIVLGREEDGRWWADIESMPGVMAYGDTREAAIANVRALALRVAADCIDHGEEVPEPFAKVFSVA